MSEQPQVHVSWGPAGERLSPVEKQHIVDGLLADAEKRREQREKARAALGGLPFVAIEVDELANIYARFLRLTKLGQATVDEWLAIDPAIAELKHKIFDQSDFGAVFAGQNLPHEVRKATREKVMAEVPTPPREPQ